MSVRPEMDETERETWRQSHVAVQPPLDIKNRVTEAREILAKTQTKIKHKEQR